MGAKSGGFKDAEHDCFRYHDRTKFYPNQPRQGGWGFEAGLYSVNISTAMMTIRDR